MTTFSKLLLAAVILIIVASIGAVSGARYLVGHLNGTGNPPAQRSALLQYSSEDSISFMYPESYELASQRQGTSSEAYDVLALLPRGYTPPVDSEAPPSISLAVFQDRKSVV